MQQRYLLLIIVITLIIVLLCFLPLIISPLKVDSLLEQKVNYVSV